MNLNSFRAQTCSFVHYQWRAEKGWYFSHTCHPCLWRHWYGLSNTKWQHSRSSFRDFESSKFSKQDEKSSGKQLCALSKNPPLWIGPVRLIGLGSPLSSQPHESLGAYWVTRKTLSFTRQADRPPCARQWRLWSAHNFLSCHCASRS